MQSSIVTSLDHLAAWRGEVDRNIAGLSRFLSDHELLDGHDTAALAALRERLSSDKLVLAFVAEFSRGKSELINALFFSDAGRRVLPATPGRTTMSPVELAWDAALPPRLSLLPIETRLQGLTLSELRECGDDPWQHVRLDPDDGAALAQALSAVTETQRVSTATAAALGFWSEAHPEDNAPIGADGQVEVPVWRHALINYPHPLLQRGLVVLDTPGLNAIGAEPELTLSLLPSAHAAVFVLAADTGVTRSDLAIWREQLGGGGIDRFVVLNKIDALADPLTSPAAVQAQIERQRNDAARMLDVPPARVFPVSARTALAARVGGDARSLADSRLVVLEDAISSELLPRRQQLLVQAASVTVQRLHGSAGRRLSDRRRQHAEQVLELRGLRGKSGAKVRTMLQRVDCELADFERCTARLSALLAVQGRLLRDVLETLSSDALRSLVAGMQSAAGARPLQLSARRAFEQLFGRLQQLLTAAELQADEMRQMLNGSFQQMNAEYGFAFALGVAPVLQRYTAELALIGSSYSRYLGLTQSWRMAAPGFAEQFRRMLLSKLRVVFESVAGELELWSRTASDQVDLQLRERRRAFQRRRDALERIQAAAGELEQRIAEVEANEQRLEALQRQVTEIVDETLAVTRGTPAERTQPLLQLHLRLDAA